MSGRQLDIFKKRQRGTQLPAPLERRMHIALADALRLSTCDGWRWSHIPLGEYRTPATAALLARMGVKAGVPDFMFVGPGAVFFIELKRPGSGRLSEQQQAWQDHIIRCGHGYLLTDSVDDALDTLRDLGIVRARVSA